MSRVLVIDEDPADAILVREALLECDPSLDVECVRDTDELLCSFSGGSPGAGKLQVQTLELMVVGIRDPGSWGCQFLRRLRARPEAQAIRVVVLTERWCEPELRRACGAGDLLHLYKPDDYPGYRDSLRQVLVGGRQHGGEGKGGADRLAGDE